MQPNNIFSITCNIRLHLNLTRDVFEGSSRKETKYPTKSTGAAHGNISLVAIEYNALSKYECTSPVPNQCINYAFDI